jgi:hypothetical protein
MLDNEGAQIQIGKIEYDLKTLTYKRSCDGEGLK